MKHLLVTLCLFLSAAAYAMPGFARQTKLSCVTCHSAFPKLNAFGEQFADGGLKLPNWKDGRESYGDGLLAIPKYPPLGFRMQGFIQTRESESRSESGAIQADSSVDYQAPYLMKMLSGGPLTEHVSYYFYAIFAEKGENGEFLIEDAWFSYDRIFGSGIGLTAGQFQIADLMFAREVRLNFQDYLVYRMAGITYDRGLILSTSLGPLGIDLGSTNGNGIKENFTVNSPGFQRPDHLFDDNSHKSLFARIGTDLGAVHLGLFGLNGERRRPFEGALTSDTSLWGIDFSAQPAPKWSIFGQYLASRWDDFIVQGSDDHWDGFFLSIDYQPSPEWVFSLLVNSTDAGDLDGSQTVFEGLDSRIVTLTAGRYLARNVRVLLEANIDLLDEEPVGHTTKEHAFLMGLDVAF